MNKDYVHITYRYITLLLFLFFPLFAEATQQVVVYGDKAYPPYSYEEEGAPKGIYVDILRIAFNRMEDYDVEIKAIPWSRGIKDVKEGRSFALFPPYYTEKRDPWMLFSTPILQEKVVVFGTAEKLAGKTRWPEDFYGQRIGLNRGYNPFSMGGDAFGKAHQTGKIYIDEARNSVNNLKKLERDRIDFYINDQLTDISKHPTIIRGLVANKNHGYLGFTKSDNFNYTADFKKDFDLIIEQMIASGEIERILNGYLK